MLFSLINPEIHTIHDLYAFSEKACGMGQVKIIRNDKERTLRSCWMVKSEKSVTCRAVELDDVTETSCDDVRGFPR